jgi:hypothetical protein
MGGKWIELLKDIRPSLTKAAVLVHPSVISVLRWTVIKALGTTTGINAQR